MKCGKLAWFVSSAVLTWLVLACVQVAAATGAIAQTYSTTASGITQGALVSLKSAGSNSVVLANNMNVKNLIGIVADKPLVQLSGSGSNGTATLQIVVSGRAQVLVSDLNGPVDAGDKITASPVSGIGMKAIDSSEIVGTAQANLDSLTTVQETVTGADGKDMTIHVGLLPVAVGVAYYSAATSSGTVSSFVPPFLQTIANSLTGKQVSPLKVLLGTAALLLGFATVIAMLLVSIRSGVISIGRNPLAEDALRKGLVDVIVAAIGVLIVTLVVVYSVLLS